MNDFLYDRLTEALNSRGGAFPAIKCDILKDMLETIFNEEDAKLAIEIPDQPVTAEEMAIKTGRGIEDLRKALETMARKGILFTAMIAGKRIYILFPLIPGIIENQLMRGETDERTRKISRLVTEYLSMLTDLEKSDEGRLPHIPFARVITVDEEIPPNVTVEPYDRLLRYFERISIFALAVCHCRHMNELVGDPCTKPKDVCLALGPGAQYMIEYGLAKPITKEEALHVLKRAEEAGLVHVVSNTGKNIDFVCNCCSCHCDNMKAFKRNWIGGRAAPSSFMAEVLAENCTGCGSCIPRCPMEALTIEDDIAKVNKLRCIGCGLCISTCPSGAISLRHREEVFVPYRDSKELMDALRVPIEKQDNPF